MASSPRMAHRWRNELCAARRDRALNLEPSIRAEGSTMNGQGGKQNDKGRATMCVGRDHCG